METPDKVIITPKMLNFLKLKGNYDYMRVLMVLLRDMDENNTLSIVYKHTGEELGLTGSAVTEAMKQLQMHEVAIKLDGKRNNIRFKINNSYAYKIS